MSTLTVREKAFIRLAWDGVEWSEMTRVLDVSLPVLSNIRHAIGRKYGEKKMACIFRRALREKVIQP